MNNCWDKFDKIILICYTGNKDRSIQTGKELDRIGLTGKYQIYWSFNDAFMPLFKTRVAQAKYISQHPNMINCTMCHYRILKTAYELNFNNIFIMEDDIRFLNDVQKIKQALETMPLEYDMAMFDHFAEKSDIINWPAGWHLTKGCCSAAAYACSRNGMKKIINAIEKTAKDDIHNNFHHIDFYFQKSILGKDAKIYEILPNVAIQQDCPIACNSGFTNCWEQRYKKYQNSFMQHQNYNKW